MSSHERGAFRLRDHVSIALGFATGDVLAASEKMDRGDPIGVNVILFLVAVGYSIGT